MIIATFTLGALIAQQTPKTPAQQTTTTTTTTTTDTDANADLDGKTMAIARSTRPGRAGYA